ncbi:MAG: methyltransferase domain-containing protein [Akkermansiaceae bacterium]
MSESATRERYASAASAREAALCCPVDYDPKYLEAIPSEVIEKDYGCGDPSKFLNPGETVLDLGSGTGKICFIASQVVGPTGKVIGVDMLDDMLEVARRNTPEVAEKIGHNNVEFRKGRIQDLGLDLELFDETLKEHPITDSATYIAAEERAADLRSKAPLIETASIDVVVSNCVLNLVENSLKKTLFEEIFRVLKVGGRAVISDIVADEPVPEHLQNDADLWSGCISGAFTEMGFLEAFEEAGFHGIEMVKRDESPWQTVEGIEFRSVTIQAWKGKQGTCLERNQAAIYNGPFLKVVDDDGHTFERGQRHAVCDKTFNLLGKAPYASSFSLITPNQEIALEDATNFSCKSDAIRTPKESKGQDYNLTSEPPSDCCESDSCC